jgi:hypothetical protein
MRLWSLHPKYLDTRGLVALWRESLLAQAVLRGQTRGYQHHPQLARFRAAPDPRAAIAAYLRAVHTEATRRGYAFEVSRIGAGADAQPILVTVGQLAYEREHLVRKLAARAPQWLRDGSIPDVPDAHPLFQVLPGEVAAWEIIRSPV